MPPLRMLTIATLVFPQRPLHTLLKLPLPMSL
eukprot:CAMPEP_0202879572 /NCGR_PEP_ID=MMETSP1391-20130828/33808_1 /ASSEMBLY_ACC=CAM_ASM_000867 /TAXON_ID=1034604 /ORGANISM="Chlamydomonas leiostraca, Strain SAG 11-49" /LENGTH=31 /DNA_ID= /DNA_START= /DNA_END= /DNA_ORIENTATION=